MSRSHSAADLDAFGGDPCSAWNDASVFFSQAERSEQPLLGSVGETSKLSNDFFRIISSGRRRKSSCGSVLSHGAPHPGQPTFRNSISLDQFVAEKIGLDTRFPSINLAVRNGEHYADSISVSRSGVICHRRQVSKKLIGDLCGGNSRRNRVDNGRIEAGGVYSIWCWKRPRTKKIGLSEDRSRIDQYFQSVPRIGKPFAGTIEWEKRPKPQIDYPAPKDIADANQVIAKSKLMYDLIRLALQTE